MKKYFTILLLCLLSFISKEQALIWNFNTNDPAIENSINGVPDTSAYYPLTNHNYGQFVDGFNFNIYNFRNYGAGLYIDPTTHYLISTIKDGCGYGADGYPRSEEGISGFSFTIDTTHTYTYEWKGYFPQNYNYLTTWHQILVAMQIHSGTQIPTVWGLTLDAYGNIISGDVYDNGTGIDYGKGPGLITINDTIGKLSSWYNVSHTVKLTMREGKGYVGQTAFFQLDVDGSTVYYRNHGQVGSYSWDDYPKFAGLYDWNNAMVDVSNYTRGRRFSLVTESYKIYQLPNGSPVSLTWATPAAITYGTLLSSTQLNCSAGAIAGTMSYNYLIGTKLNAGTYTLTATFTPTDLNTYAITQKSVTLVVNKATATMSYSNTTQTYTGNPLSVAVTTSPAGLTGVTTTYNNLSVSPTNAGSYSLLSNLNNANYTATNITGTFTINKATATITISNTTQTYTGSPLSVTASVSPAISGLSITYNGSSTAPTNAGTYTVIAKLTNANYQATPDTVTLTINKANPTITWATPSAITYGTALSGTQLNASASVAGTLTYTPASGTVLNAGTQILSVNFTPTDATDYNSINNTTVSLTVNKATATITLSNLTQNYDGTPKPVTVTTSPVGLTVIATTYNGSTTAPSAVGSYPVISSLNNSNYTAANATGTLVISSNAATIYITNYSNLVYNGSAQTPTVTCAYSYAITYNGSGTAPTNVGSYQCIATINDGIQTGADTVTMTIIKATPIINWSTPTAITYGTALSGTQLNASSTTAGTFVYTPASGTVLNAGTYVLSTAFTPTDAANYNSATATVNLTVNKASATISASNFAQVYDGTPKPITASVTPSVSGLNVSYNGSGTVPTNAGSYAVIVSLTNSNYTATNVTGTLVISKVTPILSWTKPTQISESTPISSTQLNATSNIAGTFSYNYSAGTKLPAGTYTLVGTFTPTDAANYNGGTVSTTLVVIGNPYSDFFITNGKIFWYPNQ